MSKTQIETDKSACRFPVPRSVSVVRARQPLGPLAVVRVGAQYFSIEMAFEHQMRMALAQITTFQRNQQVRFCWRENHTSENYKQFHSTLCFGIIFLYLFI